MEQDVENFYTETVLAFEPKQIKTYLHLTK